MSKVFAANMRRDQDMYPGGQKKFLYQKPKSGKSSQSESGQWTFRSNKTGTPSSDSRFDLDDVWSIKKNVSLNKSNKKTDQLSLNVNSNFYSRHGGLKDRSGAGPSLEPSSSNRSHVASDSSRSWTTGRRGFSYSTQHGPPSASQRAADSTATPPTNDSPGLPNERQSLNGYRFGNSSKNSDPFRF